MKHIIKVEDFVFSSCSADFYFLFQRVSVCTVDLVYSTAAAASSLVLFLKTLVFWFDPLPGARTSLCFGPYFRRVLRG
jgi:hypothetical protein